MSDLVAFLTARLDEDEAVAQAWPAGDFEGLASDGRPWRDTAGNYIYAPRARALAEVAAKRAVLARCIAEIADEDPPRSLSIFASGVMLCLARPYANHPDFDPAWRL